MDRTKLKILYILSYRAPDYLRTKNLLVMLAQLPTVELHVIRNRHRGTLRYAETLLQLVRSDVSPDIVILGFRGHEIYPAVRLFYRSARIIFDEMMSPALSLIEEKPAALRHVLGCRVLLPLERWILHDCWRVLTDTRSHRDVICDRFGLASDKVIAVPVAADEDVRIERQLQRTPRVLYYGSFLPLHGFEVLATAIELLAGEDIEFVLIGLHDNQKALLRSHATALPRVTMVDYVPYAVLMQEYMASAWLVLGGPFGATPQAMRVVTGKSAQAMVLGIPVVVGLNDETRKIRDAGACLAVDQNDPQALANAIIWALRHEDALETIAQTGRQYYQEHLSIASSIPLLARMLNLWPG